MNYTTECTLVCCLLIVYLFGSLDVAEGSGFPFSRDADYRREAESIQRRSPMYEAESPRVLNHLLKQPILSFGSWGWPMRNKRAMDANDERSAYFYQQLNGPQYPIFMYKRSLI
ncbi:hypothetical protein M3Y99_01688100 [Aphelenchoides fujianensis]|nr:hypothetical protein M3Y99_01688100 [Aphelenchoides fujianensis]